MEDIKRTTETSLYPSYADKYKPAIVTELIREVLVRKLEKQAYSSETAPQLSKLVADEIKDKLKELKLPRYKYIVQVMIGEQKGQGVRVGNRCFWDSNCDNYASNTFVNESLFCLATAYALYYY